MLKVEADKSVSTEEFWFLFLNLEERICLRGLRGCKSDYRRMPHQAHVILDMFICPFTTVANASHHLFYSNIKHLFLNIPVKRIAFDSPSTGQLFKNIDALIIYLDASTSTLWQGLLKPCKNIFICPMTVAFPFLFS